jgi:hypothetical protein
VPATVGLDFGKGSTWEAAVAFGFGPALIGLVAQDGLVRQGYRLTKPRPQDQGEDKP